MLQKSKEAREKNQNFETIKYTYRSIRLRGRFVCVCARTLHLQQPYSNNILTWIDFKYK